MKKLSVLLAACILAACFCVPGEATEQPSRILSRDEATVEFLDSYLKDTGYPAETINFLEESAKYKLYSTGARFESQTTYKGILTEDYNIFYSTDNNGTITMDKKSAEDLYELVQDEDTQRKIINDKQKSESGEHELINNVATLPKTNQLNTELALDVIAVSEVDAHERTANAIISEEQSMQTMQEIQTAALTTHEIAFNRQKEYKQNEQVVSGEQILLALPDNAVIELASSSKAANTVEKLEGFTAQLLCNHYQYKNYTVKKNLTYSWSWNYRPFFSWTDGVGIAWDKNFEPDLDTVIFSYREYGENCVNTETGSNYSEEYSVGQNAFDKYVPGSAIGRKFDTHETFHATTPSGKDGSYVRQRSRGYMSVDISVDFDYKGTINPKGSAVGNYFHKNYGTNGSLSLSKDNLSLSMGIQYTKSKDYAVGYDYIKKLK